MALYIFKALRLKTCEKGGCLYGRYLGYRCTKATRSCITLPTAYVPLPALNLHHCRSQMRTRLYPLPRNTLILIMMSHHMLVIYTVEIKESMLQTSSQVAHAPHRLFTVHHCHQQSSLTFQLRYHSLKLVYV